MSAYEDDMTGTSETQMFPLNGPSRASNVLSLRKCGFRCLGSVVTSQISNPVVRTHHRVKLDRMGRECCL